MGTLLPGAVGISRFVEAWRWSLTEEGRKAGDLSDEQIADIIRRVQAQSDARHQEDGDASLENAATRAEASAPAESPRGHRERTIEIMQSLPASGFERLCQRLLREAGFQQVKVTGQSGDGGIDGIGILQVNAFVSFKVLFQCKRWAAAVGPSVVRDFRGAMMGRADKGLILTTATFSADAQAEAVRDGASPIELIDGQAMVKLLEELELGLKPQKTYEVDEKFFEEFSK